jgi:hypothetical protein
MKHRNLERSAFVLLTVLGLTLACSSPASASGLYFGINLEATPGVVFSASGASFGAMLRGGLVLHF